MVCEKTPNITKLEDFNGDYCEYEKEIYRLFSKDFIDKKMYFKGSLVSHKKYPLRKEMSGTFWHIVSSGNDENNREPDLRRYETIEYPAFIIENCPDICPNILVWENTRKSKRRILIYCTSIRYLVVLEKKDSYLIFWTSYPVTYNHHHEKLLKEYNEYSKNRSSI